MVNEYDIMSSMFASLLILLQRFNSKRSIEPFYTYSHKMSDKSSGNWGRQGSLYMVKVSRIWKQRNYPRKYWALDYKWRSNPTIRYIILKLHVRGRVRKFLQSPFFCSHERQRFHTYFRHCHLCVNSPMWREKWRLRELFDLVSYSQIIWTELGNLIMRLLILLEQVSFGHWNSYSDVIFHKWCVLQLE